MILHVIHIVAWVMQTRLTLDGCVPNGCLGMDWIWQKETSGTRFMLLFCCMALAMLAVCVLFFPQDTHLLLMAMPLFSIFSGRPKNLLSASNASWHPGIECHQILWARTPSQRAPLPWISVVERPSLPDHLPNKRLAATVDHSLGRQS